MPAAPEARQSAGSDGFAALLVIAAGGPADRLRSSFINGIKHLPVELTPA